MPECFVYILTNKNRSTLYIGVTNDLARRIWEHRNKEAKGFSADYSLAVLLFYEVYPDPLSAIAREKQLKGWRREKKVTLIEQMNPRWRDLSAELEQPEIVRGLPPAAKPVGVSQTRLSTPPAKPGSAQDDGEGPAASPEFL